MKPSAGGRKLLNNSILKGGEKMNPLVKEQKEKQKAISTLGEAFQEVFKTFKKFVYLSSIHDRIIVSLYVLLSYCYHEMDSVPYVYLYGPPDTGKGEVLNLFKILGFNPKYVIRITNAALKRVLKKKKFFLLDEAHVLGKPEGDFMLSIFLNGYKVGGDVPICAKGEDDVIDYPVFGPKAFATYVWINDHVLLSRCFIVRTTMPDPENRPQQFLFAKDRKGLELLAERIRQFFEKTDVRQRIMQAYLNLEEIDGIWGRAQEIVRGMRAIAKVISKEVGSDTLHDRIVEIAKKNVEDRRKRDLFEKSDFQVIASVAIFVQARKLDQDPNSFIIAEKLRNNVARRLHLQSSFRTETLGRILKDHYLFREDPKVKRVDWKKFPIKVPKTCYFLDYTRLNSVMEPYKDLIEPPEEEHFQSLLAPIGKPKDAEDWADEVSSQEEIEDQNL
jgi:hypothetical protein